MIGEPCLTGTISIHQINFHIAIPHTHERNFVLCSGPGCLASEFIIPWMDFSGKPLLIVVLLISFWQDIKQITKIAENERYLLMHVSSF
jgi:hypothetical protein